MTQEQIALWIQVAAVLAAVFAATVALYIGYTDRRSAADLAMKERKFQRLFGEQELLARLLENYGRGGSSDPKESARMGAEAMMLIGMIGPERLPELWESHAGDDITLNGVLDDPDFPDWKKRAVRVQLAVNATRRDIEALSKETE